MASLDNPVNITGLRRFIIAPPYYLQPCSFEDIYKITNLQLLSPGTWGNSYEILGRQFYE